MISTLKKINFLITKRQRKGLVILTLLLFVGMILEVFGLGILIPALSIILEPEMVEKTPLIYSIRNYFSEFSNQNFIFLFLGTIVIVYFVKSLFIIFLTFKQNRFLTNITAYTSNNLFSIYLSQPYKFHLNRNASELIKNIQIEKHSFLTIDKRKKQDLFYNQLFQYNNNPIKALIVSNVSKKSLDIIDSM